MRDEVNVFAEVFDLISLNYRWVSVERSFSTMKTIKTIRSSHNEDSRQSVFNIN